MSLFSLLDTNKHMCTLTHQAEDNLFDSLYPSTTLLLSAKENLFKSSTNDNFFFFIIFDNSIFPHLEFLKQSPQSKYLVLCNGEKKLHQNTRDK